MLGVVMARSITECAAWPAWTLVYVGVILLMCIKSSESITLYSCVPRVCQYSPRCGDGR